MIEGRVFGSRSISTAVLALSVVVGAFLCYLLTIPFLSAIVGSVTLAVLFWRLDARIRLAVRSYGVAAGLTVTIVALVIVVPAVVIVGSLLGEAGRSAPFVRSLFEAETWSRTIESHPRLAPIGLFIGEHFDLPGLASLATSWLAGWSGAFFRVSLAEAVSLMLTFYFLFYLLRDRDSAISGLRAMLPLSPDEFARVADRVVNTISATVLGMAAVAALQGFLGGAMFWWLGLSAPVFWGVVMGLLAIVPFLGAFVIWVPTALFLALSGDLAASAMLAGWGILVVGLVDNLVYPMLVGNKLMLHTIPSFVAIAGGLVVWGAPGVVLGPVVFTVSLTLIDIWRRRASAGQTPNLA